MIRERGMKIIENVTVGCFMSCFSQLRREPLCTLLMLCMVYGLVIGPLLQLVRALTP